MNNSNTHLHFKIHLKVKRGPTKQTLQTKQIQIYGNKIYYTPKGISTKAARQKKHSMNNLTCRNILQQKQKYFSIIITTNQNH